MKVFSNKNYYEVLELGRDSTKKEIKKKYLEIAKKYHPDISKDPSAEEKFKKICEAYQILSDDNMRQKYDEQLKRIEEKIQVTQKIFSSSKQTNSSKNVYIDPIYVDADIMAKLYGMDFDKEGFKIYLKSFDIENIIYLYKSFWNSFWTDTCSSILMINNQNSSKMFDVFSELITSSMEFNFKSDHIMVYESSVDEVIEDLTKKVKSGVEKYNINSFIPPVINELQIFDNENIGLIALTQRNKTLDLFYLLEYIYSKNISINVSDSEIIVNKKMKRKSKKFFILFGLTIIIIVTAIIIVKAFFTTN